MLERSITVGEVAVRIPRASDFFREAGIDYCCGGNRKLSEAVREKGLDENDVFAQLEQRAGEVGEDGGRKDFAALRPEELCEYITKTHHGYLWQNLPRMGNLFLSVMRAHGSRHPELFRAGKIFGSLRGDLEQHLLREELLLFPVLASAEAAEDAARLTPELIGEHEQAGKLLEELRLAADQYAVPSDACESYALLYRMLSELEDDLHQHIHLENNILFAKYDIR